MKKLKIKFRKSVTLDVIHPFMVRPLIMGKIKVNAGVEMQVENCCAFVDRKLRERCLLTMLGGSVAVGVKYADFQFVD